MEISAFISCFVDQFDSCLPEQVTGDTRFRDLDGWSSYTALSIMAMVDEEYDVQLTAGDIRSVETVVELYNLIISCK